MPLRRKIAVTAVFLIGFITLAASITRMVIILNLVAAFYTDSTFIPFFLDHTLTSIGKLTLDRNREWFSLPNQNIPLMQY